MKNWRECLVNPEVSVLNAIEIINKSALQIALVVDEDTRLMGTVTDGDVRRGILSGIKLEEPVKVIMNQRPIVAQIYHTRTEILSLMKNRGLSQVPVVDSCSRVVSLEILNELLYTTDRENWVVIMAGGLGRRLDSLTQDCPKPLLRVGDKPILETILQNFADYRLRRFYIAVNYKAEMIEEYFGDGAKWGIEIRYLREKERLGTAGALSLLPEKPKQPLIVMNGDLLTKINFKQLLDFHNEHRCDATICIREYKFQVPYGVVQLDKHLLTGIVEKPVQQFFVSAGIYVLNSDILDMLPMESYLDMPTFFETIMQKKHTVSTFPVREYWLDVGRLGDFEQANLEFSEIFA